MPGLRATYCTDGADRACARDSGERKSRGAFLAASETGHDGCGAER
jgi:hypothetical protein